MAFIEYQRKHEDIESSVQHEQLNLLFSAVDSVAVVKHIEDRSALALKTLKIQKKEQVQENLALRARAD